MTLTARYAQPLSGQKPQQLVMLLHGYGSDGNDLIGLAPHWASFLPDAVFVSPNAPEHCEISPSGYQWFSLLDRSPEPMLQGISEAAPILQDFITQELEANGLTESSLALVGFSQGAMMAYHVAPRRKHPCAAVIGYSGAMLALPDAKAGFVKPPVMIVHGDADMVVDFSSLEHARQGFEAAGFETVQTLARRGLGHGIDPEGLLQGGKFLQKHLLKKAA